MNNQTYNESAMKSNWIHDSFNKGNESLEIQYKK